MKKRYTFQKILLTVLLLLCVATTWSVSRTKNKTTNATTNLADCIEAVRDLNATQFWYVPAGSTTEEGLQNGPVYHMTGQHNSLLDQNFSKLVLAEPDTSIPDTASLCLGDRSDECFRWFLDSDLVVWVEDGVCIPYRKPDEIVERCPDEVLQCFSNEQMNHHQIDLPVLENETPEETFTRWWEARRALILDQVPESMYYATDCELVEILMLESDENEVVVGYQMAVKVPSEDEETTSWWAGNTADGTGDWDGWLLMYREVQLLNADGYDQWILTGCGTGGTCLTPDKSETDLAV